MPLQSRFRYPTRPVRQLASTHRRNDTIYVPDARNVMHEHSPEDVIAMIGTPVITRLTQSLKVVGRYSHGLDGELLFDNSSLKFIRPQFLPKEDDFHLKVGFDLKVNQTETPVYDGTDRNNFINFLKWIIRHYKHNNGPSEICDSKDDGDEEPHNGLQHKFDADVVCVRNAIFKIITTPFQYYMEYVIFATRYRGKIYLMRERTESEDHASLSKHKLDLSDWGHKFCDYLTFGKNPNTRTTINNQYRAVIQSMIGRHKVMYAAKVDIADKSRFSESDNKPDAFIAVKCVIKPQTERAKVNFIRNKMLFQYTDMLLTGAPRCITGYRSEDAVVEDLKLMTTDEFFKTTGGLFNPTTCIEFADKFLSLLKLKFTEDGEVWKITKSSGSRNITFVKLPDKNADNFLPDWFTEQIRDT